MTPEDQRIAIAEACGWEGIYKGAPPKGMLFGVPKGLKNLSLPIPDYLNDLNAMHEAEKVLDQMKQGQYWYLLASITTGFSESKFDPTNEFSCYEVANATAAQRAEAFLKCLNLWKETP